MNLRTFVIGDFGMQCLDDFRLSFKGREFLPLMVGGMGTNISTANLVLAIEKLGGMAHLSDAMLPDVADREIGTHSPKKRRSDSNQ